MYNVTAAMTYACVNKHMYAYRYAYEIHIGHAISH